MIWFIKIFVIIQVTFAIRRGGLQDAKQHKEIVFEYLCVLKPSWRKLFFSVLSSYKYLMYFRSYNEAFISK
jgi:hypothetical protein